MPLIKPEESVFFCEVIKVLYLHKVDRLAENVIRRVQGRGEDKGFGRRKVKRKEPTNLNQLDIFKTLHIWPAATQVKSGWGIFYLDNVPFSHFDFDKYYYGKH